MKKKSVISLALQSIMLTAAMAATCAHAAAVVYKSVVVDGVKIAYRETGSVDKPTLLLLHGVPSSSRMYDGLMRKLGDRYHMIAPDYVGFGNSDAPAPADFSYTFDHLAEVAGKFADSVGLEHYVLFMQDYGAPVGMRMAQQRPCSIQGMIFQNGNVYEEGLGKMWESRKAFWADRAAHENAIREGQLSLALTRARHVGSDPNVEAYDPDLWMDEYAYLNRPGEAAIQSDLIYDYRTNVASYPAWQKWLAAHRPPALILWGKYDQAFIVPGAEAFRRDLPEAKVVILDGGHFVMDTREAEVAALTDQFMKANRAAFAPGAVPAKCTNNAMR